MDVFMKRTVQVNMPDGRVVRLEAGLNTDVADDVAQHWYVAAHSSEPPKPSAKEAAMAEEVEALRKRAEAAEARADAAEAELKTAKPKSSPKSESGPSVPRPPALPEPPPQRASVV